MDTPGFTAAERQGLKQWFAGRASTQFWLTDLGDLLRISGFVANNGATDSLRLVSNGRQLPGVQWHTVDGLPDPDQDPDPALFRVFRWWPGFKCQGFSVDLPKEVIRLLSRGNEHLRIDIVDARGQRAVAKTASLWIPVADLDAAGFTPPPPQLLTRVMGNASVTEWALSGASNLHVLDEAVRAVTRAPLGEVGRLLEWGSGCGRLSRHLVRLGIDVTGIDIDAEAVAWCNENLRPTGRGKARFIACSPQPPTALASGSFDAAVGVSVMAHLDESSEQKWLREMARLLRPGGVLAITTHGLDTYSQIHQPSIYRELMAKGTVSFAHPAPDDPSGAPDEATRQTWHSEAWIRKHWTKQFVVQDIWRGAHGGFQDLVVMRRR